MRKYLEIEIKPQKSNLRSKKSFPTLSNFYHI